MIGWVVGRQAGTYTHYVLEYAAPGLPGLLGCKYVQCSRSRAKGVALGPHEQLQLDVSGRSSAVCRVGTWQWPLFPPLDLGKKSPEIRGSSGRDWTQACPGGQGTTLHHHQAAAATANANHPRASTANSTVLATQARDES